MRLVFNLAYEPDCNGIEYLIGILKQEWRKKLTQFKVENKLDTADLQTMVEGLIRELPAETVQRCAVKGFKHVLKRTNDARQFEVF